MNGCSRNSYSTTEKIVPVRVLFSITIYWCSSVVYELLHPVGSALYKLRLLKDSLIL